jgi:hypothetical protein
MTNTTETIRRLAAITDVAEFERIATSVLRAAKPDLYANLSHPGTQPGGKTVKSPFDNVGWVESPTSSRFVCAAHTTAQKDLAGKWLHDPSTVTPKKSGRKPTQQAGDLTKAIEEVRKARTALPELEVTLALTANTETSPELRIDVQAKASSADIDLDVWAVSRIADFLDTNPAGQWVRRAYFGRPIELLSVDVLLEVGRKSLADFGGLPPKTEQVARDDIKLPSAHTLLIGDSGQGKTAICSAWVEMHLDSGRPAVVLHHEAVERALTLTDALDAEIRRQHPNIEEGAGGKALALCQTNAPLLVLVEDINKSSNPGALLNKVAGWTIRSEVSQAGDPQWHLLCPLWPRQLALLDEKSRKNAKLETVEVGSYTDEQASQAVVRRALASGRTFDATEAARIAGLLGNDALLIALYDFSNLADPRTVVGEWVGGRLRMLAQATARIFDELKSALGCLVKEMLTRRTVDPTWDQVVSWDLPAHGLELLRVVLRDGSVVRLQEGSSGSRVAFRHDRVMGRLFSLVAAECLRDSQERYDFLTDPFFAESVASAVVAVRLDKTSLMALMSKSPTIGAYSFKQSVESHDSYETVALEALQDWVSSAEIQDKRATPLRWAVALVLAETEAKSMGKLLSSFPTSDRQYDPILAASFRNGAFHAGLYWFGKYELSLKVGGQERILARAIRLRRAELIAYLQSALQDHSTTGPFRVGAIRLAGHLGDPSLTPALENSWDKDDAPALDSYLWAVARCHESSNDRLLTSVCDAWERLPDQNHPNRELKVTNLASDGVAWLFGRYAPDAAVPYFVARAKQSEALRWPITYMLRTIDRPDAVEQLARYCASRAADSAYMSMHSLLTHWEYVSRERGAYMSPATKQRLLDIALDSAKPEFLRTTAFQIWEVTVGLGDVVVAKSIEPASPLYARAIWARARRQDVSVIPELIARVKVNPLYWLQTTRYLGSSVLLPAIIDCLDRLCENPRSHDQESDFNALTEALSHLGSKQVEQLLAPRWEALSGEPAYIQLAALSPSQELRSRVAEVVRSANAPKELFKDFVHNAHWHSFDGSGPEGLWQMEAMERYFCFIEEIELLELWMICTKRGWLDLRSRSLDALIREVPKRYYYLPGEAIKVNRFDDAVDGKHPILYRWIIGNMDRGASRADTVEAMFTWLDSHLGQERALSAVAEVLTAEGTRADVERLRQYKSKFPNAYLIANVEFNTWSRTLN